ncbi:MAG: cytochrome c-type biogenesis protein CcmH [Deltaproteobacteria bacterium]|nr:MAG: cytochrome c-type biogenesis protein CcmH [Deltaproteobacteria bacterium]
MIWLWLSLALAEEPEVAPAEAPAPIEAPAPAPSPVAAPTDATPMDPALVAGPAVLPAEFGPPGTPVTGEALERLAHETGMGLRCPSCQGLSVAESPATSARTMNQRVHDLLAAGYSREQVEAYFVSRYGEWILLDPPTHGLSWLLWLLPAGGIGAVFAWALAVGLRWREEEELEGPTEEFLVPKDPFEKRILEEIE